MNDSAGMIVFKIDSCIREINIHQRYKHRNFRPCHCDTQMTWNHAQCFSLDWWSALRKMWAYSYFPAFWLTTKIYRGKLRILSKWEKIQTKKTLYFLHSDRDRDMQRYCEQYLFWIFTKLSEVWLGRYQISVMKFFRENS